MKIRHFFFILALCQSLNLSAQQFPSNIEYCYSFFASPPPGILSYNLETIGDTLIDNKECIILDGAESFGFDFRYINYEGNQIYRYSRLDSQFYLLYDFDLIPGDTLTIDLNYMTDPFMDFPDTATYQITSIDYLHLENDTLIVQEINQLNAEDSPLLNWGSRIIERIGADGFFVPYSDGQEIWMSFSSARNGNEIIYKELLCTTSTDELDVQANFQLFPNPAKDFIELKQETVDLTRIKIEIYNSLGQLVSTYHQKSLKQISIRDLKNGAYWVKVYDQEGKVLGLQALIKC